MDETPALRRPAIVWFKAQSPGFRSDGSSLVTFAFAEALASDFDLHLVCLPTKATVDDPASRCVPPFSSATIVQPAHHGGALRRVAVGGWYRLLDAAGVRPLAASLEGSRRIGRAVRDDAARLGATHLVTEYWTTGRIHQRSTIGSTLLLHDVEHVNIAQMPSSGGRVRCRIKAWRARTVKREETRAYLSAERVLFLSDADRACFAKTGVSKGSVVEVPAVPRHEVKYGSGRGTQLVMLGGLAWWPNAEGVEWFFEAVWPDLARRCPDARVALVGAAPQEMVERWTSDHVRFVGFVADLAEELCTYDIGVVPVRFGTGVKTKTIDLLAAGLPIVSTTNGVRGTSAESAGAALRDDPAEFAVAVCELVESAKARNELAAAGRAQFLADHGAPIDPTLFVGDSAGAR